MKSKYLATCVFLGLLSPMRGYPDEPISTIQYVDPSVLFGGKMTKLDRPVGPFGTSSFNVTELVAELLKMKPEMALYSPDNRLLYVAGDPELVRCADIFFGSGLDSERVMTQIYQGSLELRMIFAGDDKPEILSCKIMFSPSIPAEIEWVDSEGKKSKVVIGPVYCSDDARSVEGDLLVDAHVAGQSVRIKTVVRAPRGQEQLVASIPNAKGAKAPDILCFVKTDADWNEYEREDETVAKRAHLRRIDAEVRESLALPAPPEKQTDKPSSPNATPSPPDRTQESRLPLKPGSTIE